MLLISRTGGFALNYVPEIGSSMTYPVIADKAGGRYMKEVKLAALLISPDERREGVCLFLVV